MMLRSSSVTKRIFDGNNVFYFFSIKDVNLLDVSLSNVFWLSVVFFLINQIGRPECPESKSVTWSFFSSPFFKSPSPTFLSWYSYS